MTLSDGDILWELAQSEALRKHPIKDLTHLPLIEPFDANNLQPASVDLTLAEEFLHYPYEQPLGISEAIRLDQVKENPPKMMAVKGCVLIPPQGFVLGRTEERVNIPDYMVASVEGKSSLARLGLFVHITAGFVDPGFRGTITLEFFNGSPRYIELVSGIRICQIAFERLIHAARRPYGSPGLGSKYQDQENTTPSKYQG